MAGNRNYEPHPPQDAEKAMLLEEFGELIDTANRLEANETTVRIVRSKEVTEPERVLTFQWNLPPRHTTPSMSP